MDRDEKKPVSNPLATVKGYPDVFDDFDCRPENTYPEADREAVTPEHVKRAIEERRRALAEAND